MSYRQRFCPTCGAERTSLGRQCVFCGSPVRLAARKRPSHRREEPQTSIVRTEWRTLVNAGRDQVPAA